MPLGSPSAALAPPDAAVSGFSHHTRIMPFKRGLCELVIVTQIKKLGWRKIVLHTFMRNLLSTSTNVKTSDRKIAGA